MAARTILFYRCPDGTVAFDAVIVGGSIYRLDQIGMCPLCGMPVAEHVSFTLNVHAQESIDEEAA
ncbi:MAG TPA: hypothetical protein VGM80_06170 [Gaiellaceae bacterium]